MSRTNDPAFDDSWLPAAPGALRGGDGLRRSLERWAADAAVDEAARARMRERWLRIQADEEATLLGVLIDLAEQGRPVNLEAAGHRHQGVVVGVGADFAALRTSQGQDVLVRTVALSVVRGHPASGATAGDRPPQLEVDFASVLGPLAADRPTVLVRTLDGTTVRGVLQRAGIDVIELRTDGDPPAPAWLGTGAVASMTLDP